MKGRLQGRPLRLCRGVGPTADPHLADPTTLDFLYLKNELVNLDDLTHVRHPPKMRQQKSADGLKAFTLDLDAKTLPHLVHADFAAEDERATAFVGDRLALRRPGRLRLRRGASGSPE